jgi:competence protein ComGC
VIAVILLLLLLLLLLLICLPGLLLGTDAMDAKGEQARSSTGWFPPLIPH